MDRETQIRRLVWWNQLWIGLLTIGVILGGGYYFLTTSVYPTLYELKAGWSDEGLRFTMLGNGPYVVTHLVDWKTKSWTELSKPIVVLDSYGAKIPMKEVKKLAWRDMMNEPCEPPKQLTEVEALYYRSLVTERREKR